MLDQINLTDIYRTSHPTRAEYTFSSVPGIFTSTDHVTDTNQVSANLRGLKSYQVSFLNTMVKVKVKSCPTLCNPMGCSLPGSSVHGIFQAIVLEWIAISFSRGSSQPRDRTWVPPIVDRRFTVWATRAVTYTMVWNKKSTRRKLESLLLILLTNPLNLTRK